MIGKEDELNIPEGQRKFSNYIFVQNLIATLWTVPLIILAKHKPPTPPSNAATVIEQPLQF